MGLDVLSDIRVTVATLLWQPVKFGGCSQTLPWTICILCSGVRQRIRRSWSHFQTIKW